MNVHGLGKLGSWLLRRRPLLAVIALALAASACGVPIDTAAHPIPSNQIFVPGAQPFAAGGTRTVFTLYFISLGHLAPVLRPDYAYSSIETTANAILSDLDNGPLATEGSELITLLNPGISCTYNPQNHLITVNLNAQFLDSLFGPSLYDAYGQITLTLLGNSQLAAVDGIDFASGGTPTYAYLPNETATRSPVTRSSYISLLNNPKG